MSQLGKVLFGLAAVSFLALMIARAVIGHWHLGLWVPLVLIGLFIGGGVLKDFQFYVDIFGMRTTKHGMNLGVMVLIVFIILVAVNYIAKVQNIKWDVTEEKLNSIADSSKKILDKLDADLEFIAFFRNTREEEMNKMRFKRQIGLYTDESSRIKVKDVDPLKRPDLTKKYGIERSGKVILVYKGKENSIDEFTEEKITNAIIKISRDKNKVIYFLTGHNERNPNSDIEDPEGASVLKKTLEDSSYEVKELSLIEKKTVPEDADVIALLGPKLPLLPFEVSAIENFARRGGKLFLAGDPGEKHNLGTLMKTFGVNYGGDYIIDQVGQMLGASAAMAIGVKYSDTNEITKDFSRAMTGFHLASSLKEVSDMPMGITVTDIVTSSPSSFSVMKIANKIDSSKHPKGQKSLVMVAEGKLKENDQVKTVKEFTAVVSGDSDFFSNQLFGFQLNRDLVMNVFAFLARDTELVSIRPKQPKGTSLRMEAGEARILIYGFYLSIPFLLFILGGFIWFRRRGV